MYAHARMTDCWKYRVIDRTTSNEVKNVVWADDDMGAYVAQVVDEKDHPVIENGQAKLTLVRADIKIITHIHG